MSGFGQLFYSRCHDDGCVVAASFYVKYPIFVEGHVRCYARFAANAPHYFGPVAR